MQQASSQRKAWRVTIKNKRGWGQFEVIVAAASRGKAKALLFRAGKRYEFLYTSLRAVRASEFDDVAHVSDEHWLGWQDGHFKEGVFNSLQRGALLEG